MNKETNYRKELIDFLDEKGFLKTLTQLDLDRLNTKIDRIIISTKLNQIEECKQIINK
ncbi:MAG: hypothetical protein Unbinned2903contig1001_45 [Prokaryotic dsDNA virus sp.]|nr:MAG: hypothetical protein Unbinned2903contig1001_45 [Prokaryotic dsDNA virus sp.]|tara:strand:+ start:14412 stop:14585 length:174 start_codon:yes stop_codon:yes gene_type:complete